MNNIPPRTTGKPYLDTLQNVSLENFVNIAVCFVDVSMTSDHSVNIREARECLYFLLQDVGFPDVLVELILTYDTLLWLKPCHHISRVTTHCIFISTCKIKVQRSVSSIPRKHFRHRIEWALGQYMKCILCQTKTSTGRHIHSSKLNLLFEVYTCSLCDPYVDGAFQEMDDSTYLDPQWSCRTTSTSPDL